MKFIGLKQKNKVGYLNFLTNLKILFFSLFGSKPQPIQQIGRKKS
jgi:hypothetical protein